jgi:hypothetical protein
MLKDKHAKATVNDSLALMKRFNIWVEATVKCNAEGVIMITNHTHLKEY